MNDLAGLLPLVLIVVVFWFLVIRPARKRQRDMSNVQSGLMPGTAVMLGSGIYGTVVAVREQDLDLEVATATVITVARQAVVRVLEPEDDPDRSPDVEPGTEDQ